MRSAAALTVATSFGALEERRDLGPPPLVPRVPGQFLIRSNITTATSRVNRRV